MRYVIYAFRGGRPIRLDHAKKLFDFVKLFNNVFEVWRKMLGEEANNNRDGAWLYS